MRRALLAFLLVGCASNSGTPWPAIAAQADEGGLFIASETALLLVPGNLSPRETPAMTAMDAASTAWVPFSPNDCVTALYDHATITYTLDDCNGPFNLVQASGHLAITYLEPTTPGHLLFHAETSDLVLNGGAVTFTADAEVVHDTAMQVRTITLTIDTTGVGPRGTHFTRHGTQTARWFDTWGCLFVDTASDTLTVGDASWDMSTTGLTLCVGECPDAGGTVTWTGAPGAVSLSYGGMASADWTVEGDPSARGSMPISCGTQL